MLIKLKSEKYEGLFAAWEEDSEDIFQFAYKSTDGWRTFAVASGPKDFEISDDALEHLIGFVESLHLHFSEKVE